jgi:hypothetical protein
VFLIECYETGAKLLTEERLKPGAVTSFNSHLINNAAQATAMVSIVEIIDNAALRSVVGSYRILKMFAHSLDSHM